MTGIASFPFQTRERAEGRVAIWGRLAPPDPNSSAGRDLLTGRLSRGVAAANADGTLHAHSELGTAGQINVAEGVLPALVAREIAIGRAAQTADERALQELSARDGRHDGTGSGSITGPFPVHLAL